MAVVIATRSSPRIRVERFSELFGDDDSIRPRFPPFTYTSLADTGGGPSLTLRVTKGGGALTFEDSCKCFRYLLG
jgi:hypothetical protein